MIRVFCDCISGRDCLCAPRLGPAVWRRDPRRNTGGGQEPGGWAGRCRENWTMVLDRALYGGGEARRRRSAPDAGLRHGHRELRRKSVTLQLLWQEYRASNPAGYSYSQHCDVYRQWKRPSTSACGRRTRSGRSCSWTAPARRSGAWTRKPGMGALPVVLHRHDRVADPDLWDHVPECMPRTGTGGARCQRTMAHAPRCRVHCATTGAEDGRAPPHQDVVEPATTPAPRRGVRRTLALTRPKAAGSLSLTADTRPPIAWPTAEEDSQDMPESRQGPPPVSRT